MKDLDFLPRSYHETLWRREQTRRNVLMCIGLLMAMACQHGLSLTRVKTAQAALADLRNGSSGWQSARAQSVAVEARKAESRRRLDLISRLDDAAPLDAAIGEAARLLSESMALTGVYVGEGTPEPASAAGPNRETGTAGGSAPPPTRARLTGLAASDVEVGVFLGKLSTCPLFADVSLNFSRDTRESGRKMREFEVKFTLRPVENVP